MPLTGVTVEDPMLAAAGVTVTCPAAELAAKASMDCGPVLYKVTAADVATGSVYNVATATGTPPDPDPNDGVPPTPVTSPPDDTDTPGDLRPELTLVKDASLKDTNGNGTAEAGETIVYTFTVKNAGNVTMDGIEIDDPMLAAAGIDVPCTETLLDPGAQTTCTSAPYTVTDADVTAGKVYNAATAQGVLPDPDGPDGPRTPPDPDGPGPKVPGDPVVSNEDDTETPTTPAPPPPSGGGTGTVASRGSMPRTGGDLGALWAGAALLGTGVLLLGAGKLRRRH